MVKKSFLNATINVTHTSLPVVEFESVESGRKVRIVITEDNKVNIAMVDTEELYDIAMLFMEQKMRST